MTAKEKAKIKKINSHTAFEIIAEIIDLQKEITIDDVDGTSFGGVTLSDMIKAMKVYAKEKCEIQRALCATEAIKNFYLDPEQMGNILNAIEPTMD